MGNTKRPASSVTAVRTLPCVLLVSVTVAPGSIPACESWTDPVTDALVVCASSAPEDSRKHQRCEGKTQRDS